MGYKQFTPDILQAQDVNEYLMNQAVMVFDSVAARNLALTAPTEGMIVYLKDTNVLEIYDGSAWVGIKSTTVTATPSGADGGFVMRPWTNFSGFNSLATTGMTAGEYVLLSDGTDTYLASGVGGWTWIQGGNEAGLAKVIVKNNDIVEVRGFLQQQWSPTYNGDNVGNGTLGWDGSPWRPPTTTINNQSWFNTSNGRFTVQKQGYVLCSFNSLINFSSATSHAYVEFQVDGVRKSVRNHTSYQHGSEYYEPLSNTAIVFCSDGQYVTCNVWTVEGAGLYGGIYGGGLTFRWLG